MSEDQVALPGINLAWVFSLERGSFGKVSWDNEKNEIYKLDSDKSRITYRVENGMWVAAQSSRGWSRSPRRRDPTSYHTGLREFVMPSDSSLARPLCRRLAYFDNIPCLGCGDDRTGMISAFLSSGSDRPASWRADVGDSTTQEKTTDRFRDRLVDVLSCRKCGLVSELMYRYIHCQVKIDGSTMAMWVQTRPDLPRRPVESEKKKDVPVNVGRQLSEEAEHLISQQLVDNLKAYNSAGRHNTRWSEYNYKVSIGGGSDDSEVPRLNKDGSIICVTDRDGLRWQLLDTFMDRHGDGGPPHIALFCTTVSDDRRTSVQRVLVIGGLDESVRK